MLPAFSLFLIIVSITIFHRIFFSPPAPPPPLATKTKEESRTKTKPKGPKQQKTTKQRNINNNYFWNYGRPKSFQSPPHQQRLQALRGDGNRCGKQGDDYVTHLTLDVPSQQNFYRDCKILFNNKADFTFASKLSARLSQHKESQFVIFIVGLNEGKLLEAFLQFTPNIVVHSFDIQKHFVSMARKKYGMKNNNLVFNHLGFSNSLGDVEIGGVGEVAGLYNQTATEEFMQSKHGLQWPKHNEIRRVNVTTAVQYANDSGLERIDYTVIDAEGHESHIIQGMQLHDDRNKMKFGTFQYELGTVSIITYP